MSRKYEGLIVLNSQGQEDSLNDLVTSVAKEMEGKGAKMDEIQQLGRKKFAYNARHLEGGHYVSYVFNAAPEAISSIKTSLDLNNNIYMHQYRVQG